MSVSNRDETAPLIYRSGIPTGVKDTREPYQKQLAVYLILASTVFERLAFYALMTILSTTLQVAEPFHWDIRHTKTASDIFTGTTYISTLIFAVISDALLGRAKTIIIGFAGYLIGLILVTITASGSTLLCRFNETDHRNATVIGDEKCAPAILGTLIFTAIGAGAVKSNLAVFGAEQTQESKPTSRYFDKYAVAVSIGIMIATLVIPSIQNVLEQNYFVPYLVAVSSLCVAALLFIIGWRFYIHVKPSHTVVTKCIPVVINALQSWYKFKKRKRSRRESIDSAPMYPVNAVHTLTEEEVSLGIYGRPSTLLDFARVANGGKFLDRIVNDVNSLRGALVVFTLLIPFWLVDNQISTTFSSQGVHMRGSNLKYGVPWMSLGDPVTVIIGILILNMLVYKYLDARNRRLTTTRKFLIGMSFAFLSMCIAGIIEVLRQGGCNNDSGNSNLSVYAQLPQNIFIGFSQLFGMVASYEFAYFAAPLSAQSLFMSLHFCSIGISSYIGSIYINIFPKTDVQLDFICKEDNQWYWSFYTYFFILAGVQLMFMIFFIICYKKIQSIKLNFLQLDKGSFIASSSLVSID